MARFPGGPVDINISETLMEQAPRLLSLVLDLTLKAGLPHQVGEAVFQDAVIQCLDLQETYPQGAPFVIWFLGFAIAELRAKQGNQALPGKLKPAMA